MIGSQIGDYLIAERIGGGGFATVYKAQHVPSGQVVAVKVLREEFAGDEEFIRRFQSEVELVRRLPDNAHIVRPLDAGQVGRIHYLVMELVAGSDLDHLILQQGALPIERAVNIALQIADALAVAHSQGVIHRDVKPQNVMLSPDGTAKVLDFGIARATESSTHLTKTGTLIGTPQYMAPEIWEGQEASARSDLYSLGVVLYLMIAGRLPFMADTPAAIMRQHLLEQPRPLSALRADTPVHIARVVARCLAKSPAERYPSSGELAAALQGKGEVRPLRPAARRPVPRPARNSISLAVRLRQRMEPVVKGADSVISRLPELLRGQPRAYLDGRAGHMAGYRFRLSRQDTILGQASNCAIQLRDRYLSPHHARIYFLRGRYCLYDLDSHNGTYLNGSRVVQPQVLQHGDQIQIGESIFTFSAPSARPAARVYQGPAGDVARLLLAAAIAHASLILTVPMLVPALIWILYRDRSDYVSHQAKQALLYQGAYTLLLLIRILSPLREIPWSLFWLAAVGGGLYASYRCYRGLPFTYPLLGEMAMRF